MGEMTNHAGDARGEFTRAIAMRVARWAIGGLGLNLAREFVIHCDIGCVRISSSD